jgi:hypothetical protein
MKGWNKEGMRSPGGLLLRREPHLHILHGIVDHVADGVEAHGTRHTSAKTLRDHPYSDPIHLRTPVECLTSAVRASAGGPLPLSLPGSSSSAPALLRSHSFCGGLCRADAPLKNAL